VHTDNLFRHRPSPITELPVAEARDRNIRLLLKRDDQLLLEARPGNEAFCGNKWRKLKYNLLLARQEGWEQLLTFGGAYSNHIAATAAAGRLFGFRTVGVIRGERPASLNPSLREAEAYGMQLHFLDRLEYRVYKYHPSLLQRLREIFGPYYMIPEGGTNALALKGCAETVREVGQQLRDNLPDYWCISCGTGGTLAGIIEGLAGKSRVLGFPALKGHGFDQTVRELLRPSAPGNWQLVTDYHFGGFAKYHLQLVDFINRFKRAHGILLDPLYTGKLLYGVLDLLGRDFFPAGSSVLILHSGGLQGITGFNERYAAREGVGW